MPTALTLARTALRGAGLAFRPATLDDVPWVARLMTERDPTEPANAEQMRHGWQLTDPGRIEDRWIVEQDGAAIGFATLGHPAWEVAPTRAARLMARFAPGATRADRIRRALESFESFMQWMSSPGMHADRLWVAREGTTIVGMSVLGYPPGVGNVWTDYTGTSRAVRGRGIARALKCETVTQAATLGVRHVRTNNDGQNAPILH